MESFLGKPGNHALKGLYDYLTEHKDKRIWTTVSKYFEKIEQRINEVIEQRIHNLSPTDIFLSSFSPTPRSHEYRKILITLHEVLWEDGSVNDVKKSFTEMESELKKIGLMSLIKAPYHEHKKSLMNRPYLREAYITSPSLETPGTRGSKGTPVASSPIPKDEMGTRKGSKDKTDPEKDIREENKRLKAEIEVLNERLREMEKEKENTPRLEDIIGIREKAKKLENAAVDDPDILYLSDPNRPQKIGVLYAELYGNEWIDAYTEIIPSCDSERKCIGVLLEILKNSFEFCQRRAEEQMKNIIAAISLNNELNKEKAAEMKELKHLRKVAAVTSYPTVQQEFAETIMKSYPYKDLKDESVLRFANECTELCWYMAVQNPPLWLHWDVQHKEKLNDNMFKPYTNSGTKVDFLVWPVLKMHRRGVVLAEGVCQLIQNDEQ